MRTNFILVFPFLLFINHLAFGQCIENSILINGNSGPNFGDSAGQQFTACENGTIDFVELKTSVTVGTTMSLKIYNSSTGWTNLMWSVDNISLNGDQTILIDLNTGSGNTRNVIQGQTYSLRFENTGTEAFVLRNYFSSVDNYIGGKALDNFGNVQNWDPNFLDYYFQISFNNAILSSENVELNSNNITIFPNPASEKINIIGVDIQKIKFYDIVGKMIAEKSVINGEINISEFSSGIYFINIIYNNKRYTKKIIKK